MKKDYKLRVCHIEERRYKPDYYHNLKEIYGVNFFLSLSVLIQSKE